MISVNMPNRVKEKIWHEDLLPLEELFSALSRSLLYVHVSCRDATTEFVCCGNVTISTVVPCGLALSTLD